MCSSNTMPRDMPEGIWVRLQLTTGPPMCTANIFTIAKLWKQSDALLQINGLRKRAVYIQWILLSHKEEWNFVIYK
jgi:hypothetical protein